MSGYKTSIHARNCSAVLITGGSGPIGTHLTTMLQASGLPTIISKRLWKI